MINHIKNKTLFPSPVLQNEYVRTWYEKLACDKTSSWERYGPSLANGIKGWIFSDEEILDAGRNHKLIHLDYEYGRTCSLKCKYCFRMNDERDGPTAMSDELWLNVLDQCKEMGLSSVKLLGQGELTENKNFLWAIQSIAERGITPLLFTSAHIFGNDKKCMRLHAMTGKELAEVLYALGASIMVKVNSFNPDVQDSIVRKKGYTLERNAGLERLLDAGFANHNPTRLGLEVAMMKPDKYELIDIYNLKFLLNVYIDLDPFMPCGLTKDAQSLDFEFSMDDKMEIYQLVYDNNINYGMPFRGISPYAGGQVCSQLGYGLYINLYGGVFNCPGSLEQIGDVTKDSVVNIFQKSETVNEHKCSLDNGCPYRENGKILFKGWEDTVRNRIKDRVRDDSLFKLTV